MTRAIVTGAFSNIGSAVAHELLGLQQELLFSDQPPQGSESVEQWLLQHGDTLGRAYINDLHRHFGAGASEPFGCE